MSMLEDQVGNITYPMLLVQYILMQNITLNGITAMIPSIIITLKKTIIYKEISKTQQQRGMLWIHMNIIRLEIFPYSR